MRINTDNFTFYVLAAMALILVPALGFAQTSNESLTVSCGPPAANADGSAISSAATITYKVYGGLQGTSPLPLLTSTPLASCSRTAANVDVGTICYAVSAVETIGTAAPVEGAQTAPICTTVAAPSPTPGTPTNVTVTVSVPAVANTVYVLEKSSDQLVMLPAGTVPAGTTCDDTQGTTVNGSSYNVVPHASVTWTGNVNSLVAFAKCS